MQEVSKYWKEYTAEMCVIGGSTLLYQLYLYYSKKLEQHQEQQLRKKLIRARDKKFKMQKKKHQFHIPNEILNCENSLIDEVKYLQGSISHIEKVPHLISELGLKQLPLIKSPLLGSLNNRRNVFGGEGFLPPECFIYKGSYVLTKNIYASTEQLVEPVEWLLAGPRRSLYFKPSSVKAAIVTCGGLCPGLNVVIRQIFINLNILYGCPEIWGVHFGYQGLYNDEWKLLTLDDVKSLQFQGGTWLGSSRGGFDADRMIQALMKKKINQLYVIGGDGTHRGIHALHEAIKKEGLEISVIGVPKTIDNDIPLIDKSFGFETSVSESIRAIRSAYVESIGVQHGIGLVRLMGRDAGFIAMEASNSSRDVNICLIPEAKFNIYGEYGLLEYIYEELKEKGHLVIVVAEGAGSGVQDLEDLKDGVEKDDSGNLKLPNIGAFLKDEIVDFCREKKVERKVKGKEQEEKKKKEEEKTKKKDLKVTLKYIDPTYMIRTVPANAHDVRICSELAACAVHGAMAGFTGFTVGHINNAPAMIPVKALDGKKNRVDTKGRVWQRVLAMTGQPEFRPPKQ